MHEPSIAQQILIGCDKILFSHTQRGYLFLFLDYFLIFRCFLLFYVIINFYKKYFIIIILLHFFFHENYFYFFMFRDVPGCSGMSRHVPECSVFRVLSTASNNCALQNIYCTNQNNTFFLHARRTLAIVSSNYNHLRRTIRYHFDH